MAVAAARVWQAMLRVGKWGDFASNGIGDIIFGSADCTALTVPSRFRHTCRTQQLGMYGIHCTALIAQRRCRHN
eukprot:6891396-Pyramimonas_sp.AAC.1